MPPVVPDCVTDCGDDKELQKGEPAYEIVAEGIAVMVTEVVALTAAQPPEAPIV